MQCQMILFSYICAQHYINHFGGSLRHDDGEVLLSYKTRWVKRESTVQQYLLDHIEIVGNLIEYQQNSTYELAMLDIAHQSVYQPEQQLNAKFDCNRATSLGCRNYLLEMFPNIYSKR